jgi:uncharacterized protein YndB with AHSA1/START domain
MTSTNPYAPGHAAGARVKKEGDKWTLILVRELRHAPPLVWAALTDPAQLAEWAPFDADRNLASTGPMKLTAVGAPSPAVSSNTVKRADAPKLLEYNWGDFDLRWELEAKDGGTRLTLWQNIAKPYIAWGAAGWHICFDVLDRLLAKDPLGRMAGPAAMKVAGWQQLVGEYTKQFEAEG